MIDSKYILIILICLTANIIYSPFTASQTPQADSTEKEQPSQSEQQQPVQSDEGYTNLQGDVITFKSGKKMYGVQVLRELPDKVEVQIREGIEPLLLPRRLIQNIQYDNIDLLREKIQKDIQNQTKDTDLIPGEELSQEFNQKMRKPLSDQPLSYQNIGILKLLAELTQKVGVGIEVDESIRSLPMEDRIRSFEIPAGTSLYKFLQTDFANAYPKVSIAYKFDKIYISLKNTPPQ
ncbi:MAG: hypothetical protein N3G21_06610 [Candidatus Hydrogenedentes bacterium]|nr:hypothetical protein [Candidatus Hydrogenedentota bacterium]